MSKLTPQEKRLKTYLEPVGDFTFPTEDIISQLHSLDLSSRLYIDIQDSIPIPELKGVIAYLLASQFKEEGYTPYHLYNVCQLRTTSSSEKDFSKYHKFDKPLFLLTAGIDLLEYKGREIDGKVWTDEAYTKCAEQVIGWRLMKGLSVWYIAMDNPYTKLETTFDAEDFDRYVIGSGSSGKGDIEERGV